MSIEDRVATLEHRLGVLEDLMRRALATSQTAAPADPAAALPPEPIHPRPAASVPWPARAPAPVPAPTADAPIPGRAIPWHGPRLSAEQWFGQRGVLGAGVLLLLLAGGYFVKVAIDRGWISPTARCIAAIVAGFAIAAVGWRAQQRGTKTWGAAMIGAGTGVSYVGVIAAARFYELVSLQAGLIGLAVISIATYTVAWQLEVQALGFAAAFAALLAPVFIGSPDPSPDGMLVYLGGVGILLGTAAVRRQWRGTTLLIMATLFLLGLAVTRQATVLLAFGFALTGGLAALWLRRRWDIVSMIGFLGAGQMLLLIKAPTSAPWLIVAGGLVLAAPIWWSALPSRTLWPLSDASAPADAWSPSDALFFYLVPLFIATTIVVSFPTWHSAHSGAVALMVALPYLAVGYLGIAAWRGSRSAFAFTGTTAAAIAAATWSSAGGTVPVLVLLGLTLLWAAVDHWQQRFDGRWYALLALALAAIKFGDIVRAPDGVGFIDSWAVSLWLGIVVIVELAHGLWRARAAGYQETVTPRVPAILWVTAGALLFIGVTHELPYFIGQRGYTADVVRLAGGLAVSAWWALFAGGLVVFGFYRALTPARIAGLMVAGLAVLKVVFFDLANLDQLYRVGSFIILAVVLLLVAYLYHRQARDSQDEPVHHDSQRR